jgi:phosphoglycolate phosphatase
MPLIVFDLDGTLVDSLADLTDSANELLARLGGRPLKDEEVARMVGDGVGTLVRRVLDARRIDIPQSEAVSGFLAIYDSRLLARTRPYAGVPEALRQLEPHASLAVLTNKPSEASERILSGLALRGFFRWVIAGDGPYGRKPDPGGLRFLMHAAGAHAATTIVVGDSAVDVQTARAAGVRACVARYGFGYGSRPPETTAAGDLYVDDPSDLPGVLLHSGVGLP